MSFCPSCLSQKNVKSDSSVLDTRIYKDRYKVRRRKCKECNLNYRTIEFNFDDYKELTKPKPKVKEYVEPIATKPDKKKETKKIRPSNENLPDFNEDYEDEIEDIKRRYRDSD